MNIASEKSLLDDEKALQQNPLVMMALYIGRISGTVTIS